MKSLRKAFITLISFSMFFLPNQLSANSQNFIESNKKTSCIAQTEFNNLRTNEVVLPMFADKKPQ